MKEEHAVNKIIRYIQTYLVFAFPFVVACIVWQSIDPDVLNKPNPFIHVLQQILGLNLLLWFGVLILFLTLLVVMPSVREKTLRRLANLKERDEREEYITGKASRAAYISTLSLMIFLLFFSLFSLRVYRLPANQVKNGHHFSADISIGFSLFEKSKNNHPAPGEILLRTADYSLSSSAILLILLSWQLLIFNLAARKEQGEGLH